MVSQIWVKGENKEKLLLITEESEISFFLLSSEAKLLLRKRKYQEQILERTDSQLKNLKEMVC